MTNEIQIEQTIDIALAEDLNRGDKTTELLIPSNLGGSAVIIAREKGVLAGGEIARITFMKVDPQCQVKMSLEDGAKLSPGDMVMAVTGRISSILKAERTALNFMSHLSGIATETARYVERVAGLDVKITDTRKTLPGLRMLQKYAVYVGGGQANRPNLASGILIKDNHLVAAAAKGVSISQAIAKAKAGAGSLKVEVEITSLEQLPEAIAGAPDMILLDNMSVPDMKQAAKMVPATIKLEASGGVTLDNVRAVAETGVDVISVGALTHSVKAINFNLEFITSKPAGN